MIDDEHVPVEMEWTELDLEPEVPEVIFTLIGRVAVAWTTIEDELLWQACVEAGVDSEDELREKSPKGFSPRTEQRVDEFVRLRKERIGEADGPRLGEFREAMVSTATERARLMHGRFQGEDGVLVVIHKRPKKGSSTTRDEVSEASLRALLDRILSLREEFDVIAGQHRRPNAHVAD